MRSSTASSAKDVPQPNASNTNPLASLAPQSPYAEGTIPASAAPMCMTVGPDGVKGEYVRVWHFR